MKDYTIEEKGELNLNVKYSKYTCLQFTWSQNVLSPIYEVQARNISLVRISESKYKGSSMFSLWPHISNQGEVNG